MAVIPSSIVTKDKLTLKIRSWEVAQPRAIICLVHGFGEHAGRYARVGQFFNDHGITLAAFDLRGHGESEGKRGHAPDFDAYLDDIQLFTHTINELYKNTPTFLYGHSMGGNLVLNYFLKRGPFPKESGFRTSTEFKGVITTGPWIRLAFEPKPFMITLGKMMRSIYPSFTQPSGLIVENVSKDPVIVKDYINDPLNHSSITASAGMGLTESAAFLNTYEGTLALPTLIMHGSEDLLTSQPASEAFAKRVKGDVTYKKWEGMYHEIHNEPDKMTVLKYTLDWINSKI
jgi:alpha-beta hydrolase superfamily lysophospholipase